MDSQIKTAWTGSIPSSPIGGIWLAASDKGLAAIEIYPEEEKLTRQLHKMGFTNIVNDPSRVSQAIQQILEYLSATRTAFDISLDWSGMLPFQLEALKVTLAIPYGQTKTYADIARQIGSFCPTNGAGGQWFANLARYIGVGRAEATNPIPLVIPCHRVVGTDGKLHGYGGGKGIETKAWLLKLERGQ